MEFGAHLPIMDFGGNPFSLRHLVDYATTVERAGFAAVAANDHLVFGAPWLDGPTALTAVIEHTGSMELATTVALPVVRGPVASAKTFAAIDVLSGGRLVLGVGPGSSATDHRVVGLDFDERWKRLDESIMALRSLWERSGDPDFDGAYYSTDGVEVLPRPCRPNGPPIWIGSWGSAAGLRRVARLGDGWLASAYNTTPDDFAAAWARLGDELERCGRTRESFPNALATMWFHVTDDPTEAEAIYSERIEPNVNRPPEVLRDRLPVGPPELVAKKLIEFRDAGLQRVYVWPVADELTQIERFAESVAPLVTAG